MESQLKISSIATDLLIYDKDLSCHAHHHRNDDDDDEQTRIESCHDSSAAMNQKRSREEANLELLETDEDPSDKSMEELFEEEESERRRRSRREVTEPPPPPRKPKSKPRYSDLAHLQRMKMRKTQTQTAPGHFHDTHEMQDNFFFFFVGPAAQTELDLFFSSLIQPASSSSSTSCKSPPH